MADYRIKRIDDMEAIFWGAFRRTRAELGLTSFGAQIMELPPHSGGYPEHDHTHDGQEEMFVVLRGSGEIELNGERHPLDTDTMVGVQAGVRRKVHPGPEGMRLLIVGGTPGKVYEIVDFTELGAPDPSDGQPPPQ